MMIVSRVPLDRTYAKIVFFGSFCIALVNTLAEILNADRRLNPSKRRALYYLYMDGSLSGMEIAKTV